MLGYYNYTVILTYCSLLSAVAGIFAGCAGRTLSAVICLLVSGLFDMFDGQVARTRKSTLDERRFGIQIDSLADLVAFGVLPCLVGVGFGMRSWWYVFVCGIYVLAALIRLAYFNVMEEKRQDQTDEVRHHYTGLPVTSAALIFPVSTVFVGVLRHNFQYFYAAVMLLVAGAFVSKIKVTKPGKVGKAAMVVVGAIIACFIFYIRIRYHK